MLYMIWLVLCVAASALILLPLALWRYEIYKRYAGSRLVSCPENHHASVVNIDTSHAIASGIDGHPDLRLSACTRWPERAHCDQACLPQALEAELGAPPLAKPRTKQIYHLPVILAAFAAWYLGAIWHSRFMFGKRWLDAIGLQHARAGQIMGLYLLLSLIVSLLFAYGVAWLLAVCHRKGILYGVLMSGLLCATVIATRWYGIAQLPRDILSIDAGYVAATMLLVGMIVGGLYDKLVLPSHD